MTFSIIIPTIGRETINRTYRSIASQNLKWLKEVVTVRDDPQHRDWGAWARTEGMQKAKGDFLLFMDDDDEYLPGAFEGVQKAIQQYPRRVHIFRMLRAQPFNDVIWKNQDLMRPGQVSTQMIAVPNDWRLGEWTPRYEGDFDFLTSTLAKHDNPPVWHDQIITLQHPHGY